MRRISAKSLGTFFAADEVAAPLGLGSWIGLPEAQQGRVARIEYAAPLAMEEMTAGRIGEPRASNLAAAVVACLA